MGLNNGVVQMKTLLIGLSGFLLTVALPVPAGWAATTVLSANLSQANEVPPNLSPGIGTAIVTLIRDCSNTARSGDVQWFRVGHHDVAHPLLLGFSVSARRQCRGRHDGSFISRIPIGRDLGYLRHDFRSDRVEHLQSSFRHRRRRNGRRGRGSAGGGAVGGRDLT